MKMKVGFVSFVIVALLALSSLVACAPATPPTPPPPAPAAFKITKLLITPIEAKPGENVTITAEVTNTGGSEGSYTVELKVNQVAVARQTVTILAGLSKAVTFTIARDAIGTYQVTVNSISKEFVVKPGVIRIEETDPAFVYSPGWKSEQNTGASGGSWVMTGYGIYGYTDIKVEISFKGTGVSLVHAVGPWGGMALLKIDGKDYPSIDMYAPIIEKKITSIATDLADAYHILTIRPSKDSNPAVSLPPGGPPIPIIVIDAIDIIVP